jgi:hypothetical protein
LIARLITAGLLAVAAPIAIPDPALGQCESSISGGVYTSGTYGAHGEVSCPDDGPRSGSGVRSERTVRIEPTVCAGTPDARLEVIQYFDATGALIDTVSRCIGPNVPGDPAPIPPTVTDVMQRLPLPMPEIHTSPRNRGLVGIETWLWWGGEDTPPPVVIGVDGWTATVQPRLARVEWDMGNGDVVEGNGPGSEAQPSATYVYERQCDCTITVTVVWGGSVTFSHPLVPAPLVQESPGVPFTTSMPYEVDEREAVIVR